jgi:drug/metabolite transporter (DMT)-like permease
LYEFALLTVAVFVAAGLSSGLFGRVCQYAGIRRMGASRTSPLVTSAGLVSVALAVVFLDERVTLPHVLGILLMITGVVGVSWETATGNGPETSGVHEVRIAVGFALAAAIFYGIEPVLVKFGLRKGINALLGLA